MTAAVETTKKAIRIARPDPSASILLATGPGSIAVRAGTVIEIDGNVRAFEVDTAIDITVELAPGTDYCIGIGAEGAPIAAGAGTFNPLDKGWIAGFHFAPGSNAQGRSGGDDVPAINPFSLWDAGFRPACPDPRGMALIEMKDGKRFWSDIYLLGTVHREHGTSRFGVEIADGWSLDKLDYPTTVKILQGHGKRLMTYDEFRTAAFGVTEKSSAERDPGKTGLDVARTSRFGLMQATGNLWVWGTDGDPDDPRPSIFGGSWLSGDNAGSRYATLDYWPDYSRGLIGARGACDHL